MGVTASSRMFLPQQVAKLHASLPGILVLALALTLTACSNEDEARPTRTPVPTWTATPDSNVGVAGDPNAAATEGGETTPAQPASGAADTPAAEAATETPTAPPSDTPTPESPPTETPTPEPTATPAYLFELETAEKFPTDTLAANMVRVYLYVYSEKMGLSGYSLRVNHEGKELLVDSQSDAGLPAVTRDTPGPYSRFTNLNAVFVEPQGGRWEVQLIDEAGTVVGPPVTFELTADEVTRELYVRYRLK